MTTHKDDLRPHISTVLLATDFLQNSRLALDYAVAFAHRFQAGLITVNAFELGPEAQNVEIVDHRPSRTRRDAERRLEAFTVGLDRLGIAASWALVEGTVPSAILEAVSQHKADLLVLGTQGIHRGLNHLLIGSNTEALMLSSPCPTLTIGPRVYGGIDLDLRFMKILYLSDFTIASAEAAPYALALSTMLGADVEIYQLPPEAGRHDAVRLQQLAGEYCATLLSSHPEIAQQWCDPEFQQSRVRTPEELLAKCMDTSNLIVLGVLPTSYLARHLHTSLAYRILADAASPVLTVPQHSS